MVPEKRETGIGRQRSEGTDREHVTVRKFDDVKHAEEQLRAYRQHLEELVKERTAALAARERHLNVILNGIPGAVAYWDRSLHSRYANPIYHEWVGHRPGEIEGRHFREVLGDAVYEARLPIIERVLRGEAQTFDRPYPLNARPEDKRWAEVHYVPDREGDQVLVPAGSGMRGCSILTTSAP